MPLVGVRAIRMNSTEVELHSSLNRLNAGYFLAGKTAAIGPERHFSRCKNSFGYLRESSHFDRAIKRRASRR